MGYRQPEPPPAIEVPYGRFAPHPLEGLFVIVILVVAVGVAVFSTKHETLSCEGSGGEIVCRHGTTYLGRTVAASTFRESQIGSVEWREYTGDKRRARGRTEVLDERGTPLATMFDGSRDRARRHYEAVAGLFQHLGSQSGARAVVEQRASGVAGAIVALLLLGWLGFELRSMARRPTAITLVIDQRHEALEIRTRHLGLLTRVRRLPLEALARVVVDEGRVRRVHHKYGAREAGARLRLRYEDGSEQSLVDEYLPKPAVHVAAAERLREALDPGRPLAEDPAPAVDPPAAVSEGSRRGFHLVMVALGVLVIGGSIGGQFFSTVANVSFRAERRCRFRGSEMVPPAEMTMSLEPGTYELELYDSEAPGGWRTRTFEVPAEDQVTVVCD